MHGLYLEMVDRSLKNVCHNIFAKVMSYSIELLKFLSSQHYNNKKIYSIKRIKLDLASAVRLWSVCGPAHVEHSRKFGRYLLREQECRSSGIQDFYINLIAPTSYLLNSLSTPITSYLSSLLFIVSVQFSITLYLSPVFLSVNLFLFQWPTPHTLLASLAILSIPLYFPGLFQYFLSPRNSLLPWSKPISQVV